MRSRRPLLLGLVVAVALALALPALADSAPADPAPADPAPATTTTTDTGGIQVQTAQPVVEQVAGAHVVRRAKKPAAPAKGRGGHQVVPAATVATLPFTGARPGPVAALGLVLLVAGAGLRRAAAAGVSRR